MAERTYRHEYKYCIHRGDAAALRSRLQAFLSRDRHGKEDGGYLVRSLYFDTPEDKALRDKLDGVARREKIRLRHYGDDFSLIRLERKTKINGFGHKEAAYLSLEEAKALLNADYDWLKHRNEPLLSEIYAKLYYQRLQPKTLVEYNREPFVFPAGNVRITLDSEIKTGLYATDFFRREQPTLHCAAPDITVLEVKYDAFLPQFITDLLQLNQRQAAAFSKYAAARRFYFYL